MKVWNRIAIALAAAVLAIPAATFAQQDATSAPTVIPVEDQATKEQLARLFEVMRLRQQFDSVLKMMPAMVQQQVQAQTKEMESRFPNANKLTAEQKEQIQKLSEKFMQKALSLFSINEMIDDMTVLYQRHLSRSDVEAFIAFYSSAPGQHLLNEQPAIMREYMPMVMKRTQERTRQLTDEMTKDMDDLIKSSANSTNQK